MNKGISDKVIQRLALYHSIVEEYIKNNEDTITSSYIASLLKVDDSQVRKDISLLYGKDGSSGKCRVGYLVSDLKSAIEKTLGFSKPKDAFIVGAGNLGMALAKYDNFTNYGLNVLALFDNDPLKVGNKINQKEVFHISKLPEVADKMNVEIIILTVPQESAQDVVDFLANSNIRYIWNFSPSVLKVPQGVEAWNENLMGNFLQFSYRFAKK